jgi:predicted peptidase
MQKLTTLAGLAGWAGLTIAIGLFVTACKKGIDTETTINGESVSANAETAAPVQRSISYSISSNTGGYLENLPAGYYSNSTTRYPLLISVHGAGDMGNGTTDLWKVANVGIPKLIRDKQFPPTFWVNNVGYSFIVIAPQYRNWPSPVDIRAVIDYSKQKYRIDASRVYVSGFSMGGGVVWDFASYYGTLTAAVAPICGALAPNDAAAQRIAQARLPIWAFHNQDDPVVPYSHTTGWINKINNFGAYPRALLSSWPTGGHDAWTNATNPNYRPNGKNLYEWLLQYRR